MSKCTLHLVTGILGSGKTTLLEHLIGRKDVGPPPGVVVGEFAEVGYDGDVLRQAGAGVVELTSTGLGDDQVSYRDAVRELVLRRGAVRVFLETSGVAELDRIATDLLGDPELADAISFGPTVVVLDAGAFDKHQQHFAEQLWAQVAVADILVINKVDLAPETSMEARRAAIEAHNPTAKVLSAYMGQVPHSEVLDVPEGFVARLHGHTWSDGRPREFQSFVWHNDQVCFDRVTLGHLLLNLPGAQVARFKGRLRGWNRSHSVNGLPGQLDWDTSPVTGKTAIVFIGLGLADHADAIRARLDAAIQAQQEDRR